MGTPNRNISRFEVTGVFTHPDARVDIVLVHGLNGQPERTWTAPNHVFWPIDLLPVSLLDTPANILVYGYNADVYSRGNGSTASDNFIFQHAQTLVAHLTIYRQSEHTSTHPIIWVAHSLGGILLKRALLYSNDIRATDHEAYRSIYVSTHAIIFLGTPHTGSGVATWGRVLQGMSDAVVPRKLFESESILLKTLKKDNERLQEINSHFLDIYQRFHIHMVHENHKTNLKGTKALIVDADSASPQLPGVTYYGIEATHSGMCKFSNSNAPGYRTIATAIREWVVEAPPIIEKRWAVELKDREDGARRAVEEQRMHYLAKSVGDGVGPDFLSSGRNRQTTTAVSNADTGDAAGASAATQNATKTASTPRVADAGTSPMPTPQNSTETGAPKATKPDPPFLHPEPFRENSYFVGREKEMADLHRRLTDPVKRAQGTSAVVIHSLTGGGKTHLARQYVFRHRDDYPGGIYWVRAKSIPEMEQFYWKIAKTEDLRNVVQRTLGRTSPTAPSDENTRRELSNPKNVVDIVRQWFCSFDQWLLVFDGILFNTPGILSFIPDAKNTSLIYTSIQSGASGKYEFDNPQVLHLGMLNPDEAQELLLTEMEKKKPWLHDDRDRAREIVLLMDCFPLMIHTAAQHLKATHEPLHKYLRAYRTRTRAGDLSAFRAVWLDLKDRGATPALNLMSILAFLDNRIPVGLLHLGLGALDNRTPVLTRDATHRSKSLNKSLSTLMAFALIERSESGAISQTSSQSSTKRSDSRGPEAIDLLRINSVVQNFFIDVLADEKQAGFWLERAATVFCRSFNEAERLIKDSPKLGLLDDYRCFQNNGEKLLEHLTRIIDGKKAGSSLHSLIEAKAGVKALLVSCASSIERLTQASQKYIVTEMDLSNPTQEDASIVSVFENASSASDWEDSSTPSSQASGDNSTLPSRTGTGFNGDQGGARPASSASATSPDFHSANIDTVVSVGPGTDTETGHGTGQQQDMPVFNGRAPLSQLDIDHAVSRLTGVDVLLYQSPEHTYAPSVPGGDNPYHWHVPYPAAQNLIPAPPTPDEETFDESDEGDDGAATVVPTPRAPPADTGWNPPAFQVRYNTLPPGRMRGNNRQATLPPTAHRTVRRNHSRRYHDTPGAWRDSTIKDPRVGSAHTSVSREVAKGFVYMPHMPSSATSSPGRGQISAGSEAEMALIKIRAAETARVASAVSTTASAQRAAHPLLVSVDVGNLADDERSSSTASSTTSISRRKNRSQSTGTMGVRPLLTLRRNDATRRSRLNEVFVEDNNAPQPPTSASVLQDANIGPQAPLSGWSMLKRLKENIFPSRLGAGEPAKQPRQQRQQPQQQQEQRQQENRQIPDWAENAAPYAMPSAWQYPDDSPSIHSLLGAQTGPPVQGSRTSRSSPIQIYSPFTPPPPQLPHSFHHYPGAPLSNQANNMNHGLEGFPQNSNVGVGQSNEPTRTVHRWTEEVYHTGNQRLSDTDLSFGFAPDRNSTVLQSPYLPRPGFAYTQPPAAVGRLAGQQIERALLQPAPQAHGYTSQPMSRGGSSQSQADRRDAIRRAAAARERAMVGSTMLEEDEGVSGHPHSLPLSTTFSGSRFDRINRPDSTGENFGAVQAMSPLGFGSRLHRMSRSSLVETEPSPRTGDPFPDVHTSYQLWEERHTYASGDGSDTPGSGRGYTHSVHVLTERHRGLGQQATSTTVPGSAPAGDFAAHGIESAGGTREAGERNAIQNRARAASTDSLEGGDPSRDRGRSGSVRPRAAGGNSPNAGANSAAVSRTREQGVVMVPRSYSDSGLLVVGPVLGSEARLQPSSAVYSPMPGPWDDNIGGSSASSAPNAAGLATVRGNSYNSEATEPATTSGSGDENENGAATGLPERQVLQEFGRVADDA